MLGSVVVDERKKKVERRTQVERRSIVAAKRWRIVFVLTQKEAKFGGLLTHKDQMLGRRRDRPPNMLWMSMRVHFHNNLIILLRLLGRITETREQASWWYRTLTRDRDVNNSAAADILMMSLRPWGFVNSRPRAQHTQSPKDRSIVLWRRAAKRSSIQPPSKGIQAVSLTTGGLVNNCEVTPSWRPTDEKEAKLLAK